MISIGDLLYKLFFEIIGLNAVLSNIVVIASSVIIWIFIGIFSSRILKIVIYKTLRVKTKGARALTIAKLLRSISKYVIWFIVSLVILEELNVNITPFIASAGVLGLAIGFGAQEMVRDFISGFFIIFEGSFNVGEVIEVAGFKGKVLSLGLRTTIIENWRGERKIINNGGLGSIINYSKADSIAIVDFGVAYETDLEKLQQLMPAFLADTKAKYVDIVDLPQFLGVTELANSSINLRIIAKTTTMKHFQVERDIRKDVVGYFKKNNVEIPFPQVVVHNA